MKFSKYTEHRQSLPTLQIHTPSVLPSPATGASTGGLVFHWSKGLCWRWTSSALQSFPEMENWGHCICFI